MKGGEFKKLNVDYSVDMVRLKVRVDGEYFERFVDRWLSNSPNVTYWEKFDYKGYRHNWKIEQLPVYESMDSFSYWLGFKHNAERPKTRYDLVIEYNPNKCMEIGLLQLIINTFFITPIVEVVSVDVACDVPVNINKVLVDKLGKKVKKTFDYGDDNKTYYLGEGAGRIKIYNKSREAGLDYDLTRYEINVPVGFYLAYIDQYYFEGVICPLYIRKALENDDKTLQAVLYAVQNGYDIDDLTKRYKRRVRDILQCDVLVDIDSKKITDTIRQWFQLFKELHQVPEITNSDISILVSDGKIKLR